MKNLAYLLSLHTVEGLGSVRLKRLIDYFKDSKTAWEASSRELLQSGIPQKVVSNLIAAKGKIDPEKYLRNIRERSIKVVTVFDDGYPKLLQEIADPPTIIYFKGQFDPGDDQSIGVVGTRKVTGYGKLVTDKLVGELVEKGLTVVSGLARGVDTIAHRSALKNGGRTIAVLGGGLNSIFPPENTILAEEITGNGVVMSEFPPDYPHLAGNFPARNRIISGLSLGVLVTEAAEDSGSLITARLALEQNREVFAVPGPITSDLSKGPASLIKEGAKLVSSVDDIFDELGLDQIQKSKGTSQNYSSFSVSEKQIIICLENESKHIDEICRELKLSINEISGTLVKMEILGIIKNLGGGNYIKI